MPPLPVQVINADVPHRQYWPVVLDSAVVVQQLCCAVCSVAAPLHLLRGSLSVRALLCVCAALLLCGYGVVALIGKRLLGGSVVSHELHREAI